MKNLLLFSVLISSTLMASCAQKTPMPGSDRETHGCTTSAGYQWCEKKQLCVRPWELVKQDKTGNTEGSFSHYCHNE